MFGWELNGNSIKNICLGGGMGLVSGYSYKKYYQITSIGFGASFFVTQIKSKALTYLDLNKDGKVDMGDVEILEDKLGAQVSLMGIFSFVGGFGVGYLIGYF